MPIRLALLPLTLALLVAAPAPATARKLATGETIDLNSATFDDLVRVPGIGKTKARAILEYREGHGPFDSVDGLVKVKGIGRKTVKKLAPWLRVGVPAPGTPPAVPPAPAEGSARPDRPAPAASPERGAPPPALPKDEGRGPGDVEVL